MIEAPADNPRGGMGWGVFRINDAGRKWLADSISPEQAARVRAAQARWVSKQGLEDRTRTVGSLFHSIALIAVEAAHQRASIDDVFAAVGEWETEKQALADARAEFERDHDGKA